MKSPRELGLPYDDWRPGQRLAIRTALSNKKPITVIQSPTGSGKSTIGAGIMQMDERRWFILTATKGLEDQYTNVFDFLFDIRGMGNYECIAARKEFSRLFINVKGQINCDDGPCRSDITCSLKDSGCLYFDANREAMATNTGLTNYKYHLAMRKYGRGLGAVHGLICDEAHALPEELMSANQITVPLSLVESTVTKRLPKTAKQWAQWAAAQAAQMKGTGDLPFDARARRTRLQDSLAKLTDIDETWAWDVYGGRVIFEPTIPKLLLPTLADKRTCQSMVFLSATVTKATMAVLGIPPRDYTFQVMKSRFDPKRRPVYVVATTRVDHKMSDDQIAYWLHIIDKIIGKRLDRKGIIHSVSYDRAKLLRASLKHNGILLAPSSSFELAAAVDRFRRMKPPAVLLSPSVMTGFNFPYHDCEYQILPKVPFPDTRSAIARARIAATPGYRDHLTMQAIEQAVGRGMRADDDMCETFIVDNHAQWFLPLANRAGLMSEAFLDALQWVKSVPPPPPSLWQQRVVREGASHR